MSAGQDFTPVAYNLLEDNPFPYSDRAISVISGTEAFLTGIDTRDGDSCIVCGIPHVLEHSYIVPQIEQDTWDEFKDANYIPRTAKSVKHEARNGTLMCRNHHSFFDLHYFYIRWIPEAKCFVLINHSQVQYLEPYHGKAVRLLAGDPRVPFHGAFLIHEMRVRGRWPRRADRSILLPLARTSPLYQQQEQYTPLHRILVLAR